MSNRKALKYKELYSLIKPIYVYDLHTIVDRLTTTNVAGIHTQIAKSIGVEPSYFRRKLVSRIDKLNLRFIVNINYPTIGLSELRLFVPNKRFSSFKEIPMVEWLKLYSETYSPIGSSLSYYIPYNLRKEFIINLLKELEEQVGEVDKELSISLFYYITRVQPRYSIGVSDFINNYLMFNRKKYEKILQIEGEERYTPTYWRSTLSKMPLFTDPSDIIDLLILRELEHNALVNILELSDKYPFSSKIFIKHIRNHLISRRTINGIFMITPIRRLVLSQLYVNFYIRVFYVELLPKLVNMFKNMPWTSYVKVGVELPPEYDSISYVLKNIEKQEHCIQVTMVVPTTVMPDLTYFLYELKEKGLLQEIKAYLHDYRTFKKFGIPYVNYDQEKRSWTLDVEYSESIIKKRILKYVRE